MSFLIRKGFLVPILFVFCAGMLGAHEEFEVKFKVVRGKELAKNVGLPAGGKDDQYYVIGTVRNHGKRNALVSIAFWHNGNKFFTTSGYREIGWCDGNDAAARLFLLPVGLRGEALPKPENDFSYRIKVLLTK